MFKKLQHKLLFWFLIFISSNLIIGFLTYAYLNQREEISDIFLLIEDTHKLLLEDSRIQTHFFNEETRNPFFFEFGVSQYLDRHKTLTDSIKENLDQLKKFERIREYNLSEPIDDMLKHMSTYDSTFNQMISLLIERGYKDHGTVSKMRDAAHELEELSGIDPVLYLRLRRHEKDFLIRYENIYLRRLNNTAKEISESVLQNPRSNNSQKQKVINTLNEYLRLFKRVVELDKKIGIKYNEGLERKLDEEGAILALQFDEFLDRADGLKDELYANLKNTFIYLGIGLIGLSLFASFFVAKRITQPLTELTDYITKFVDSNFTYVEEGNIKETRDEIGILTRDFYIMRDKIVEQLKFFKQKVEERTAELAKANEKLVKINEANSRFVPNEFLRFLGHESILDVNLGDHVEKDMTVMFSDIREFTEHSEKLTPQQNFDFINSYLRTIVPLIREQKGFIDKYIGDSVMALFPDVPDNAVKTAIATQEALIEYNSMLKKNGAEPIAIGTGIHTGHLILGTIGAEKRMETTVISDAVNIASRMEGLNKMYGCSTTVSGELVNSLHRPEEFNFRYLDKVCVKGKKKSNAVFEILDGLSQTEFELKMKTKEDFEAAVKLYQEREVSNALNLFRDISDLNPDDLAVQIYINRCEKFLKEGIPEDWDGSMKLYSK